MTWISASLISAVLLAIANVVDSHLIQKRMPSIWSFLLMAGLLHVIFASIFLVIYPLPADVGAFPWFIAILSAIGRGFAVLLMLYAMRTEEISRIIPVVNTQPIFVSILAVPILGEALNYKHWLAIVITVAGAILISVRWDGEGRRRARLRTSFTMLILSSMLFGLANLGTKYALDYFSSWNIYSLGSFCFGSMFFILSLRTTTLRQLRDLTNRFWVLSVVSFNELIALGGLLLSFWAMEKGPISLVTTIQGSRPLFVFLIALVLSSLWPTVLGERFTKGIVVVKMISIALIVGGVTIINFVGDA